MKLMSIKYFILCIQAISGMHQWVIEIIHREIMKYYFKFKKIKLL